jgi:predicted nucleic acid-binding protein
VTLIVDAGPVIAMGDRRDPRQASAERCLRDEPGALVVPAPVTAEIDHILSRRGGRDARRSFLDDLAAGRFRVECVEPEEYPAIALLERTYAELEPGLSDLSIVVLAHRLGTTRIATFDERRFRALRPLSGGSFTLLPLDR